MHTGGCNRTHGPTMVPLCPAVQDIDQFKCSKYDIVQMYIALHIYIYHCTTISPYDSGVFLTLTFHRPVEDLDVGF